MKIKLRTGAPAAFLVLAALILAILAPLTSFATTRGGQEAVYVSSTAADGRDGNTSDGTVLDGDTGDTPGVIGDENTRGRDALGEGDSDVLGAEDTASSTTFWGIILALAVAAAVILLISLIIPRSIKH